ncbi:MAG: type I-C CRISPR-associated protein Cas8c/Csd1 [Capsulimonadales bacterium]|nr:type I-C CRISPR-associated protein Cas8c/Csd1 [Capsulimonadales bacterium]
MILQSLYHDAEAIFGQIHDGQPLPPPMYALQPLRLILDIDPDTGIVYPENAAGRTFLPYLGRSSDISPILLVDNAKYVFGVDDGKTAPGKTRNENTRKAFRELVHLCHEQTGVEALEPVVRFLDRWNPIAPEFPLPSDLRSNDLIGFRVRGRLLHEIEVVRDFWAEHTRDRKARSMTCLVTGQPALVESKLPLALKGVPGANTSGAPLSSFNVNAFMSYNLSEYSAPISREAGEHVAKALNALLQSQRHSVTVGDRDSGVKYVFWSPAGEVTLHLFAPEPDPTAVRALLDGPRLGKRIHALPDDAPFHILGLSSHSGGRVALRSALHLTVADLYERQRLWFERTRIVSPNGDDASRPLATWQTVEAAFRVRKDVPNYLYAAMTETALNDAPPPDALLPIVVRRCIIGDDPPKNGPTKRREHVSYRRAALLKLLLSYDSQSRRFDAEKVRTMSDFEPSNTEKAYLCGRLLYQLERIQYMALEREANVTLTDRYYGGASTTPRAVFPALLRMAKQAHLPAIRRGRYARSHSRLQDTLAEIMEPIGTEFPGYFSAREQGSFALGYYAERARVRREIRNLRQTDGLDEPADDTASDTNDTSDINETIDTIDTANEE